MHYTKFDIAAYHFQLTDHNPHREIRHFGATAMGAFGDDERVHINHQLQQDLDRDHVSHRRAHSGSLAYIEGFRAIELANAIFGFDGWSCEVKHMAEDFVTASQDGHKWSAGYSCTVRVTLRDGTFREDVGYGESQMQPQQGAAREIARKSASTDALKRALRLFGRALGLCLYDSEFRTNISRKPSAPPAVSRPLPQVYAGASGNPAGTAHPTAVAHPQNASGGVATSHQYPAMSTSANTNTNAKQQPRTNTVPAHGHGVPRGAAHIQTAALAAPKASLLPIPVLPPPVPMHTEPALDTFEFSCPDSIEI